MTRAFQTFSYTNIGHRDENQDRLKVFTDEGRGEHLLVVADGMGGHHGGSIAAQAVVDAAADAWEERSKFQDADSFLADLCSRAHEKTRRAGEQEGLEPRSTLAALYITSDRVDSVHVGDSRILQFSKEGFVRRTVDHSVAQLQVMRGKIAEEEMATHPDQGKLITSIGGKEDPEPEFETWSLTEGDRFVLCSDGFWELVGNDETVIILGSQEPQEALESAVTEKLLETEGHDNITAILALPVEDSPANAELTIDPAAQAAPVPDPPARSSGRRSKVMLAALGLAIAAIAVYLLWTPGATEWADTPDTPAKGEDVSQPPLPNPGNEEQSPVSEDRSDDPASSPESSAEDSAPSPTRGTESDDTGQEEAAGKESSAGTTEEPEEVGEDLVDSQIRLDNVERETDIPLDSDLETEIGEKVGEELRKSGSIGADDAMEPSKARSPLGDVHVTRLQQTHKGIPVYGAQVIAMEKNGRVIKLLGETASGIDIGTVPSLSYSQTIARAEKLMDIKIAMQDEGQLIIVRWLDDYRLCWMGTVFIESQGERAAFDAETAELLFRLPTAISSADSTE